jgi:murein DD-endopeptidase MepM/ murein hydrolase activator NlpD
VSEIRLHSSDPARPTRTWEIGQRTGIVLAVGLLLAGNLVFLGLMGAADLVSDLARQADRLAVGESARISAEAFESVRRRYRKLDARLSTAELFLARVAYLASAPLPDRFLEPPVPLEALTPDRLESEVLNLARHLRAFEQFRRAVAEKGAAEAARTPSRSPVEPSTAVPVASFGSRTSPLTLAPEFFPGLLLAAPEGTPVVAPAAGTVVFAGTAPAKAGAVWRPLGTIVVLAHGEGLRTLYGHLGKSLVRQGQRIQRADRIALVGRSGFVPASRLHYEVRRLVGGRWVPVDPRFYILDADWITAAEIQSAPPPPADLDLPPALR